VASQVLIFVVEFGLRFRPGIAPLRGALPGSRSVSMLICRPHLFDASTISSAGSVGFRDLPLLLIFSHSWVYLVDTKSLVH